MRPTNQAGFIYFLVLVAVVLAGCEYLPYTKASQDKAVDNLRYERDLQKTARSLRYITPSVEVGDWFNNELDYEKYSYSAFLVSYRERLFLMTAGHVWSRTDPRYSFWYLYADGKWVSLPAKSERKISTSADLAAIDMTKFKKIFPPGAKLNTADDLAKSGSDLLVICNPFHFPVTFIGRFSGKDRGLLSISFTGTGVEAGCSGSPVVDVSREVRGLIVQGSANLRGDITGKEGYAVSADKIAKFLDVMFFEK